MSSNVEVICWFDREGSIRPLKFKCFIDGEEKVIAIGKILGRDLEKLAGCKMWNFKCSSVVHGIEQIYNLKYDIGDNKWLLIER